jgi:CubicO group peptidase (beta-lactamase class C family)
MGNNLGIVALVVGRRARTSFRSPQEISMQSHPNPDLDVGADARPRWNSAAHRRHGFHNLHRISRYVQSYRAGAVLDLALEADLAIPQREDVARLTASPWFSGMVIARGNRVLYERRAPDFGADQPHSVQSITKTLMNLVIGQLASEGRLSLSETVGDCLPWIGPGFAAATLQDVMNMNVVHDYDEDYLNPNASVFLHEAATGMRLPTGPEPANKAFLATIGLGPNATDTINRTGAYLYRSANTDVLAAVAEARGGKPMAAWLADIADAAGVEGALHMATDRTGFPFMNGGMCITARDLARYGLLLARRGAGVNGGQVGDPAFFDTTLQGGIPMAAPRASLRYSNQINTDGVWIGHGGYGGQYLLVDMKTGTVGVYLSVLQDANGYDAAFYPPVITMLAEICAA